MKNESFFRSVLPFLLLMILYAIIIVVFTSDKIIGDEVRYLRYAENLLNGFYTHPSNPDLSNGPGYPLVLLPFVALHINLLVPKLLNGIFVFIGVIYFYKTLRLYTKEKYAYIFAFLIGLYPPMLRWMILLYSESLTFMLICGFIFHFCFLFQRPNHKWKACIWAAFYLGFLVLAKIVFFQVLLCSTLFLAVFLLTKKKTKLKWAFLVLAGTAVFISPYVTYAYLVTNKLFYLGTRGGEILYHRATPFDGELGNWFSFEYILNPESIDLKTSPYQNLSELSANHKDFYLQVLPLTNMERDSAFKAKAIEYMKENPSKYLKNTIANAGRLLFNYPISYRPQSLNAYGYILPNMFIVVLFLLILYPAYLARRRIPFEIKSLLIFALIYAGGMILLGGKGRYLIEIVPPLLLFFAFVFTKTLKITMVKPEED